MQAGDDSRSLFARADSALYSAKAAGPNRLFVHTGTQIREHLAGTATAANKPGVRRSASVTATKSDEPGDAAATLTDVQELAV